MLEKYFDKTRVILDSDLSFKAHINKVIKTTFFPP